jgi:hypothetical protein
MKKDPAKKRAPRRMKLATPEPEKKTEPPAATAPTPPPAPPQVRTISYDADNSRLRLGVHFAGVTIALPIELRQLAIMLETVPWRVVNDADGFESFADVHDILVEAAAQIATDRAGTPLLLPPPAPPTEKKE